jgi:Abnormal spindle-like microcephaly-assoc'd, ASPM-SPD-2-Hydin
MLRAPLPVTSFSSAAGLRPRLHAHLTRFLVVFTLSLAVAVNPRSAAASPSRLLNASPTSISFGNVGLGASASQQFTLTSAGNASVKISQITLTGNGFTVSTPPLPISLGGGQSLSVTVSFAPAAVGMVTGTVTVVSNASNSPAVVALSGTGVTLQLRANPTDLAFGNIVLGASSILPVVLTNTGSVNVTVSQVNITGTGFSYSGLTLPATISPGQNATLSMTFAPTAAGSVTANASIVSNAQNSPAVVSLSGTGASAHSVSLSWDASGSQRVTGYNVYRGMVSGGPYTQVNSSLISGTAYTDTTVLSGQSYYYVATAVDSQGLESAYSNETQAVVPSP